jgi:enamine deaminase RidA (YjgF/YER057c/UK114 family)
MAAKPSVDINTRRIKMGLKIKNYPLFIAGKKQPYSKSVAAGNIVLCAGMDGADPQTDKISSPDIASQTTIVLDKVKDALSEAGTAMDNIIRTVIFLKDMKDSSKVREAKIL